MSEKLLEGIRELKAEYLKRLGEDAWQEHYRAKLRARVAKLQELELDVLEWLHG